MVSGNIIMDNIQNKWYYHSTDKTNIVLYWQHVQKVTTMVNDYKIMVLQQ